MRHLAFAVLIVCAVSLAPAAGSAQGQPGSAGGTIGKQGRSASGSEDDGSARSAPERERPKAGASSTPRTLTAASLRGRWTGSLNCPDGHMVLTLTIRESSAASFGGDYGDEGGRIVSGQFDGGRITFVTQAIISRSWSGRVSRSGTTLRMQGTHKADWGANSPGAGNCKFSATKG